MEEPTEGMVLALMFSALYQILVTQKNVAAVLVFSEACHSLPSLICWDEILLGFHSSEFI